MKTKLIICSWLCTLTSITLAQDADMLFQPRPYFSFTYDNDFFNATDRYYTQGIRLEFGLPIVKKSPVSKLLMSLKNGASSQYAIALAQDCFTPYGISRDTLQTKDRPYAGLLYLSHVLTTAQPQKRQQLITRLDIGIIGPCAQCKEMQMGIHRLLDNIQPKGWKFQLANDLVLNYAIQFEKGIWLQKCLELLGYSNVRLGTLYDDFTVGSRMRFGFFKPYFGNLMQVNKNRFYIHCFVNGNVKTVIYNATLQGGLFNPNDIHTLSGGQIKRILASGTAGIVMSYKKVNIEFARVFLSPDYKGGLSHGWGHVNIGVDF